ncbi:MAG: Glu-tRNA(Gln) amidotransferase subunit GatE [Thermoplasmata archaeon]
MESQVPIKVGLEIHQQLATHKLFCNCESSLVDDVKEEFVRRLRPTQSELGEVDRAALEEASKGLVFRYQASDTSCLVEADEEPPHEANREAIETVLKVALMLGAEPVNEIHFMRKIVIDGSNTTGFQRSALVALNGSLEVNGKLIGIPTICLEEDAARVIDRGGDEVVYRLDRLGIPLIEVATTPDIESPEMAREVALKIGRLLRATRRVLRGIGTIREDLNVSVEGGARVEIKGVQDLRMISAYAAGEVKRQLKLLEARDVLRKRGVRALEDEARELNAVLQGTKSQVLREGLRPGSTILGLRLQGFAGLLADRLGPEMAAHAAIAGAGGILHSDELPAYGITPDEVEAVRKALRCEPEDAFVLVASEAPIAGEAIERVRERATTALEGVPEETRDAKPDGSTVYSRPLPGSARMYPETDVPPIRVSRGWLRELSKDLPETPEAKVERLEREFNVHRQQVQQLVDDGYDDLFEELSRKYGNPAVVARTFLNHLPELKAEGVDVEGISDALFEELFAALAAGGFAKEAVPTVLKEAIRRGISVEEALEQLGIKKLTREGLEREVDTILEEHLDILRKRGEEAMKPLMGVAMERLRGRAEGKLVNEVLRARLKARLQDL